MILQPPKWASKVKEDWSRAQNISQQLRQSLPPARADSFTEPMFNTRDSTLDITENFRGSARETENGAVVYSRSIRSKESNSSDEDLPSVGELKDSIKRYTYDYMRPTESEDCLAHSNGSLLQGSDSSLELAQKAPSLASSAKHLPQTDSDDSSMRRPTKGRVFETLIANNSRGKALESGVRRTASFDGPKGASRFRTVGDASEQMRVESGASSQGRQQPEAPEPVRETNSVKETRKEVNAKVEQSTLRLKSVMYEAYFMLGVICGIVFLTVLIAETEEPKVIVPEVVAPQDSPKTEAEQLVEVTNSWASWIRGTSLFSLFYSSVYWPMRELLVQYLSWIFQT